MSCVEYFCLTRGLKNGKHLRSAAPRLIPSEEPLEGYASLVPWDVLSRLHATRPSGDLARQLERVVFPAVRPRPAEPLFKGTLVFAAMSFVTRAGSASMGPQDLATAKNYARLAAVPISRYASQYGANSVAVTPTTIPFTADVPRGRYNDQTLQGWVNTMASGSGLPPNPGIVILNPRGVVNTDADPSRGVGGYHSRADVPYAFVNVLGSNLTIRDEANAYAMALSHEIAEMVVDPRADLANPEVCDPCGPNCQRVWLGYFDPAGRYIESSQAFPPSFDYGFYINGIVQPGFATQCPAPGSACRYAPP